MAGQDRPPDNLLAVSLLSANGLEGQKQEQRPKKLPKDCFKKLFSWIWLTFPENLVHTRAWRAHVSFGAGDVRK
jgi:hypothetical protein